LHQDRINIIHHAKTKENNTMNGETIRFERFFGGGQNVVIVAVDHGMYNGPLPGFEDLPKVVSALGAADGILMSPGMARHCREIFCHRGAPAMILRLNWGTQYCTQWDYQQSYTVPIISPSQALAEGADWVLVGMSLKNVDEATDINNIEVLAKLVAEKRIAGIPLIGEPFPAKAEDARPEELQDLVAISCRVAAEIGVNAIKTFYTGKGFADIVRSTPVPIMALGARKLEHERQALELAASAVRAGARGVVFGRNVVMAREPARFLDALLEVVKQGRDPAEVATRYNLT
jgi:class I fructose-bisphosphate aldolase